MDRLDPEAMLLVEICLFRNHIVICGAPTAPPPMRILSNFLSWAAA